jgi:hypothetical protein
MIERLQQDSESNEDLRHVLRIVEHDMLVVLNHATHPKDTVPEKPGPRRGKRGSVANIARDLGGKDPGEREH